MKKFVHMIPILILLLSFIPALSQVKLPAEGQTHVRVNIDAFMSDPQKVESLRRGISVMKSRNSEPRDSPLYRTSWEYWAAIHGFLGFPPAPRTIAQQKALVDPALHHRFDELRDLSPPPSPPDLAATIWFTCQHSTEHFFTWHRMYLYFFERVLRQAANDPTLSLPYWDYTRSSASARELPLIFREPANAQNSLFDRRRNQSINLLSGRTNIDKALRTPDFSLFQSDIEGGVHGHIHCEVGGRCPYVPLMSAVPLAALDPIFWLHHANIDRLWQCWAKKNPKIAHPGGDWLAKKFTFVDETGSSVSMSVNELFKPSGKIDYRYDNSSACARSDEGQPTVTSGVNEEELSVSKREIAVAEQVAIRKAREAVPLALGELRSTRLTAFASEAGKSEILLKLAEVKFENPPAAPVDVFLSSGSKSVQAGTMSFFGAGDDHVGHSGSHAAGANFVFNVTDQIRELVFPGTESTSSVRLEFDSLPTPGGPPLESNRREIENAKVVVGSVSFIELTTDAAIRR